MNGVIFDVKEFTIHDGPGSRMTVFLKGCPLRCRWCHNPEGLSVEKQLMYKSTFCSHCRNCEIPCEHEECRPFGRCIHACQNGCLTISGENVESKVLAEHLLKNKEILSAMNGGVTISGGEPMMQHEFVCELTEQLEGMHKAIQTSGYADLEIYQKVIKHFDYVMQDIKIADCETHKKYTGVKNTKILRNIEWLKQSEIPFVFRVPLIPDITDTEENLCAIAKIAGECRVELMPYNEFAGAKYSMVNMEYTLNAGKNRAEDFTRYFQNAVMLA